MKFKLETVVNAYSEAEVFEKTYKIQPIESVHLSVLIDILEPFYKSFAKQNEALNNEFCKKDEKGQNIFKTDDNGKIITQMTQRGALKFLDFSPENEKIIQEKMEVLLNSEVEIPGYIEKVKIEQTENLKNQGILAVYIKNLKNFIEFVDKNATTK